MQELLSQGLTTKNALIALQSSGVRPPPGCDGGRRRRLVSSRSSERWHRDCHSRFGPSATWQAFVPFRAGTVGRTSLTGSVVAGEDLRSPLLSSIPRPPRGAVRRARSGRVVGLATLRHACFLRASRYETGETVDHRRQTALTIGDRQTGQTVQTVTHRPLMGRTASQATVSNG